MQARNVGQTLTDSFTAFTVGGTSQLVTITIDGANDAAVISGDSTGSVVEAGGVVNGTPGTSIAAGDLECRRRRQPDGRLDRSRHADAGRQRLRELHDDCGGLWTYTLDNNNAAVQALNAGDTLTDTFTAFTVDGTAQLVTITIHGTNDAAVIGGVANGAVVEAGGVANGIPGTTHRDRRSQFHRRRQSGRRLDGGQCANRERQRLRQLHADSGRGLDLHAGQQQCRRCRHSMSGRR